MKFSILVVCLNAGDKLKKTVESICAQTYPDYEIVVKDGMSEDGCLDQIDGMGARIIQRKDTGIYDAMNQAVQEANGEYIYFLNCGDVFYHKDVLKEMAELIPVDPTVRAVCYGNIFERVTGQAVMSNPALDAFGCYRNVPCHQACFYKKELLLEHPFETRYRVRADYEQFLWCFFEGEGTRFCYRDILVADYEGGGFSETKENLIRSEKERREIVQRYMTKAQIRRYRLILLLTLAPLRTKIAGNKKTAGIYNKIKKVIYGK